MDREISKLEIEIDDEDEEWDENFGAYVTNPKEQVEEHEGTTFDSGEDQ
jgi:hypothetical protein